MFKNQNRKGADYELFSVPNSSDGPIFEKKTGEIPALFLTKIQAKLKFFLKKDTLIRLATFLRQKCVNQHIFLMQVHSTPMQFKIQQHVF